MSRFFRDAVIREHRESQFAPSGQFSVLEIEDEIISSMLREQ